jgi:hypothetical protein
LRSFLDYRQGPQSPLVWWLVDERPRHGAYFVGYDQVTNARVGFLGVRGFRDTEPPDDERFRLSPGDEALWADVRTLQNSHPGAYYPFPSIRSAVAPDEIPPWFVYVRTDDGKVHQIDLARRAVSPLPPTAPVQSLDLGQRRDVHVLLARTADEVIQLNVHNDIVNRVSIPQELRNWTFNWGETSKHEFIAYTAVSVPETTATHIHYYWIDRDGTVTEQAEFTLAGYNPVYSSAQRILPGALMPAPVGAVGFVGVYWPLMLLDTGQASAAQAWPRALEEFWPSVLLTLLVAGTLAGMCYCRQSRYRAGRAERLLWPLFVFALGVPGWIGYRFGRSWPVLEKCPSCGRPVPQDRPACAVCQAEFPLPPLKGTEVFA